MSGSKLMLPSVLYPTTKKEMEDRFMKRRTFCGERNQKEKEDKIMSSIGRFLVGLWPRRRKVVRKPLPLFELAFYEWNFRQQCSALTTSLKALPGIDCDSCEFLAKEIAVLAGTGILLVNESRTCCSKSVYHPLIHPIVVAVDIKSEGG